MKDVPTPVPRDGEVLVEVGGSGVCGTDLHMLRGENLHNVKYPVILGHEFYGRVAGWEGDPRGLEIGQWIVIDPAWRCGACPECQRGRPTVCDNKGGYGVGKNGGFAEFAVVPREYCVMIPDSMPPHWSVLAEPLACVLNGLDRVGPVVGDKVLVFGAGTIGLLLARALQLAGASRVGLIDTNEQRLQSARGFIDDVEVATSATALDAPRGWDVVADATGAPAAMESGLAVLGKRGRFLMMGVTGPADTVTLRPMAMVRNEQSIISSVSVNFTVSRAVELLAQGVFRADLLLGAPFALEQHSDAFAQLTTGSGTKVVMNARA
jgi:2-desacetyl-2-hydroxyethyl bacteriochlorophyllide A dehydrogenase